MKNFKNLFLPRFFFSPSVFIVMFLWTTYVHFLDFTNNSSSEYFLRFAIVTIVFLVSIILLVFTFILFLRVDQKYQPYVLLISIITVAAIRGYLLDTLLERFLIEFDSRIAFRIASSILNFTTSAILATIANGKVREQSASVFRLMREQNRLAYVEKVTKENLLEFDRTQIDPIKKQLLASVDSLRTQSVDRALLTIRSTIDEIVQPLSRSLDELISQWSPPEVVLKDARIRWGKASRKAAVQAEVEPKITPVIMTLIGIPTMITNYGPVTGSIMLVQSLLTGYFIYKFMKIFISKISSNAFGFVLTLSLAGLAQGALTLIWSYPIDQSLSILIITPGAAMVIGFLVALVNSASNQLSEVHKNISQTTADLSWAVSRIRNEQHQRSRNLGRKLHGEIQARFSSAFLMLQNSQGDPDKAKSIILEIADNLEKDVLKLENTTTKTQNLDEVLENIKETWQGLANIKFIAEQNLKQRIQNDNLCQTALVDVIPELCFNSIKHGKASEVVVSLEQTNPKTIILKVQDNGNKIVEKSSKGLGTKLLDECAISWKREKANDLVITSAEFAFSF